MGLILPEQERELFDSLAKEHLGLSVGTVEIYSATMDSSGDIDPLYQEPQERWTFTKYEVTGWVRRPEIVVHPLEPGRMIEKNGVLVVARKHLEENEIPFPQIGDVVKFWEQYYDVVKAEPMGFKSDANFFTHWRCELVRRTRYLPDVKTEQK